MKGDRVEVVVDTGHGTQTFEILASRAGRRLAVTTARGVVEVTEGTRGRNPVRTGRFMASRVVALVEHPALEDSASRVEVETRRRMTSGEGKRGRGAETDESSRARRGRRGPPAETEESPRARRLAADQLELIARDRREAETEVDPIDTLRETESDA